MAVCVLYKGRSAIPSFMGIVGDCKFLLLSQPTANLATFGELHNLLGKIKKHFFSWSPFKPFGRGPTTRSFGRLTIVNTHLQVMGWFFQVTAEAGLGGMSSWKHFLVQNEHQNSGWLGCIGDEILPSYIGIVMNHEKNPYWPTFHGMPQGFGTLLNQAVRAFPTESIGKNGVFTC